MKTLTLKQIKDIEKAQALISKAYAIIQQVETNSDLKYTPNKLLSTQAFDLVHCLTDEVKMLS